jgi:ADP-heptose:LPS heptosyltransferase
VPSSRDVWKRRELHTVEDQLASLKYLGYPVQPIPPLWAPLEPEDTRFAREKIAEQNLDERFVLVHPGAAFATKQWQLDRFAGLVIRLIADDLQVAATAGPGEEGLLTELAQLVGQDLKVIAPLSLSRFAALVSFCSVYVGNDTGSTHIATAVRKPVVVIFGSSDSSVWYPWQTEFRVIKSDLDCVPCPGYHCLEYSEPKCIRTVEVEGVFQAVKELLQAQG